MPFIPLFQQKMQKSLDMTTAGGDTKKNHSSTGLSKYIETYI